jgi:hypothetical protein
MSKGVKHIFYYSSNNNYTDVESFAFKIIVMYNGENASDHSSTVVDMYNKYTNMFFQKIGL